METKSVQKSWPNDRGCGTPSAPEGRPEEESGLLTHRKSLYYPRHLVVAQSVQIESHDEPSIAVAFVNVSNGSQHSSYSHRLTRRQYAAYSSSNRVVR